MHGPAKILKAIVGKNVYLARIFPDGHTNIFDSAVVISEDDYKKSSADDEGIVVQPEYHNAQPISRLRAGKFLKW